MPLPALKPLPGRGELNPSRWYLLLLCVLAAAGAVFVWLSEPPLPPPPEVDTSRAAPQIAAAIDEARSNVLLEPASGRARGRLGMLYLAHEFRHEARECFAQAIRLEPRQFRWRYYSAVLEEDLDLAEAVQRYKTALLYKSDFAPLYLRLGHCQVRLNQIDEARRSYGVAAELAPDSPYPLLGQARLDLSEGHLESARLLLEEAVRIAPWSREVQIEHARLLRLEGDLTGAARVEETIAGLPASPLEMPDSFLIDVEQFELSSNRVAKQTDQLLAEGKFDEAAKLLNQLIADRPDLPRLRLNLGQIQLRLGNLPQAIRIFRDAVERFPEDPTARFALGTALESSQRLEAAASAYSEAARLKPDYAEAHYRQGRIWNQMGKPELALPSLQAALAADPGLVRAQVQLAQTLVVLNRPAEALEAARRAARLAPQDPEAAQLLERLDP